MQELHAGKVVVTYKFRRTYLYAKVIKGVAGNWMGKFNIYNHVAKILINNKNEG